MHDPNKIEQYIKALEELLSNLKAEKEKAEDIIRRDNYLAEFTQLRMMINSGHPWPMAVPHEALCDPNSEDHKKDRAIGILEGLPSLTDLAFLDFGCGQGHVSIQALNQNPVISIGYDIEKQWQDTPQDKLILTTNFSEIEAAGPFDAILCNDVLDHAENESPIEILKKIKNLCHDDSPIYIRCHPWTSRHATHLYHQINKAYLHLVFSELELLKLGCKGIPALKTTNPLAIYRQWFAEANLSIHSEVPFENNMESFFANYEIVSRRIKQNCGLDILPIDACNLEFVDFLCIKS